MSKYFKTLSEDFGTPTDAETIELERIGKEIETLILVARKNGETHVNVSSDLWRTPFFRFHLTKDLLKMKLFVDSPSNSLSSTMKISWCNEDILNIHRECRLAAIEKIVRPAYNVTPKVDHLTSPSPIFAPSASLEFGSPIFGSRRADVEPPSRRRYAFDLRVEPEPKRIKQDS